MTSFCQSNDSNFLRNSSNVISRVGVDRPVPPCGVPVHISAVDVDAHPLRKLTARGQTVSPPPETFTGFFRRSKSRGPLYLVRGRCRGGPATDDIAATTDTKISFGSGRSWAGSPAYRPQVFVHHDVPTLRLTTTSGTITTTATHPVYAHGRGYVPADQLHTGDTLHTPDGTTVKVQAIQATGTTTVHNLHVPATNNYHVHTTTNQPILVHNDGTGGCGTTGKTPEDEQTSLRALARQVRTAGDHEAAINRRTFAVGEDSAGKLYVGSSNGFDKKQADMAEELGLTRVPSRRDKENGGRRMHAEENLVAAVPDLKRKGTDVRMPCDGTRPRDHNCEGLPHSHGIEIER